MNTTKKVFGNVQTKSNVKSLFAGIQTFPKRDAGKYQVVINSYDTVGTEKIYFKLEGKFVDNGEPFQDLKPLFAPGTNNQFSQSMEILNREIQTAYFSNEDFSENILDMYDKLLNQELTVTLSYNENYKNYNYLPNLEDVEHIEL